MIQTVNFQRKASSKALKTALLEANQGQIITTKGYRVAPLNIQQNLRDLSYRAEPVRYYKFLNDILMKNPKNTDTYFGNYSGNSNVDNYGENQDFLIPTECHDTYEKTPRFAEYKSHLQKLKALSPLIEVR